MFCPNCGKQLPERAKFCTACGTALTEAAPAPSPEPAPVPQEEAPGKKKTGLIVGLIAAVAAAALGAFVIAQRLASGGSPAADTADGVQTVDPAGGVGQAEAEADGTGQTEGTADGGAAMLNYVQPTEMGDDPFSFVFELDGVLYQLPAPISVFEDNGWTLEDDEYTPDELSPGATWTALELRKGNSICRVGMHNYSDSPAPLKTCPVVEFNAIYMYGASSLERGAISSGDSTLAFPSGVTTGMSWTELRATADMWKGIYGVDPAEQDDDIGYYTEVYVYMDPDAGADQHRDYVRISYDIVEGVVDALTVHAETMEHDRPAAEDVPAPSYEILLANRGITHEPAVPEGAVGEVTSLAEFIRDSVFGRNTVVCADYVHTDDLVTACTITYYTDASGVSEGRLQQMQEAADGLAAQYAGYPNASVSYGVQDREGGSVFACVCQFLGLDQADPDTLATLGFNSLSMTFNEQEDMGRGALKKTVS